MKNVIESLFAGLLENSNVSDKAKKNTGDNKDNFSSDINEILSLNIAASELENNEIKNIEIINEKNNSEKNIVVNKLNSIETTKEFHEAAKVPSKNKELKNIKEHLKNGEKFNSIKGY